MPVKAGKIARALWEPQMAQIHIEIEDAAKLDGAGRFEMLARIVVPTIRSGITATAIIVLALSWTALVLPLVLPLVLSGLSVKAVTVTMRDFFLFERALEWPAALVASLLPLAMIVLAARRSLDQLRLTSPVR